MIIIDILVAGVTACAVILVSTACYMLVLREKSKK